MESLRAFEHDGAEPVEAADAEAEARRAGGSFVERLVRRARGVTEAEPLDRALDQVRRATLLIVAVGCVIGLVLGAGAARAGLGAEREAPVNFYFALLSLLGVQSIVLVVWIVLMLLGPRAFSTGSLGGVATSLGRWLAGKVHRGPHQIAAIETTSRWMATGPMARWSFSAITHAMWLSFNVGCLVALLVLLSARRYTFGWETTILGEDEYVALTAAVAKVPQTLWFDAPTPEQIRESQWLGGGMLPDAHREAWSSLLVGCVVCYGLLPRLGLLAFCLGKRRLARSRVEIDLARPGYLRLRPRLMPETASLGVVDPESSSPVGGGSGADVPATPTARPTGAPALLGLEIDAPATSWPPRIAGVRWHDLGMVDSGTDRRRVIDALVTSSTEPSTVVVVCDLTTTPDRGHGAFLASLRGALSRPPLVVLTAGQALRERGNGEMLAQRLDDWRALVAGAGVADDAVVELDLDHFTDQSGAKLAGLVGASGAGEAAPGRRIEPAFATILEHAQGWTAPPDAAKRAELHRAIARVYREGDGGIAWRNLLPPAELTGDVAGTLRHGADRIVAMLPDRLRRSPRGIGAGAAAGALGCVAAATFLAPVAIAALPTWAAIGAALGLIIQPKPKGDGAAPADPADLGDAVRAAALFAILLELQGRDETAITRILDDVIDDDGSAALDDPPAVASWLDHVRHRLDLALAREPAS